MQNIWVEFSHSLTVCVCRLYIYIYTYILNFLCTLKIRINIVLSHKKF